MSAYITEEARLEAVALEMVARYHAGQADQSKRSYVSHIIRVAGYARTHQETIVALLHDILEYTECTLEEIEKEFGDEILQAVLALTQGEHEPRADYIRRVLANSLAKQVKLYDHLDNTAEWRYKGLPVEVAERFRQKYAQDRIWLEQGYV